MYHSPLPSLLGFMPLSEAADGRMSPRCPTVDVCVELAAILYILLFLRGQFGHPIFRKAMVYRGKSSHACATCRGRKIKVSPSTSVKWPGHSSSIIGIAVQLVLDSLYDPLSYLAPTLIYLIAPSSLPTLTNEPCVHLVHTSNHISYSAIPKYQNAHNVCGWGRNAQGIGIRSIYYFAMRP